MNNSTFADQFLFSFVHGLINRDFIEFKRRLYSGVRATRIREIDGTHRLLGGCQVHIQPT